MTPSLGALRKRLGSLPAAALIGGVVGALVGGVLGRIYMRLIFLLNPDRDGAKTDFGTAGQITVDGSLSLIFVSTVAGVIGGMLYVGVRRWLPGRSTMARGVAFGLLMSLGPGFIFLGEVDLQIFGPALPLFLGFVVLIVLYGICVAMLTERLSPPATERERSARSRRVVLAVGIVIVAFAVLVIGGIVEDDGTRLSADRSGGCATPAKN